MSSTPSHSKGDSKEQQSPLSHSQAQQEDDHRPASPSSPSLPLAPSSSLTEEPAPPADPTITSSDILDVLLPEATGGHRVGERVLRRSRRTRTSQSSSRPQASSSTMVRPSPPAVTSENDSDSDPGSKISQSTTVSDYRAETELRPRRTRTLTTPHQAAVLHALLAQSRFPTTQMREEVGRAIGMSPRKVQIWFQNQRQSIRQKERQEKGEGGGSQNPPQYGSFSSSGSTGHMPYGMRISTPPPGTNTQIPGAPHQMGGPPPPRVMSPPTERSPLHREFAPEGSATRLPPISGSDPLRGRPAGPSSSRRDILPPLHIGASTPHSPLSPSGQASLQRPSRHSPLYPSASGAIPRPFTLQPDPIWAPDHPIPRPTTDHPGGTGSPLSSGPALPDVLRSSQSRTPPQTQARARRGGPRERHT